MRPAAAVPAVSPECEAVGRIPNRSAAFSPPNLFMFTWAREHAGRFPGRPF